ncbi:MAG: uncharacterized protein A8A55_3250, partial [Amphiamblys sp. WSBS2006]
MESFCEMLEGKRCSFVETSAGVAVLPGENILDDIQKRKDRWFVRKPPWSEERAEATLSELRAPQASRERAVPDNQKKRVDYLDRYFPFAVEKTQKEPVKKNRQPSSGLLDGKREIVEEIERALRNKIIVPQKEMVLEHGKEQDFCVLEADSAVFLQRVRISDRLFSLLLQKTALKIGEDVGVFPSKKNRVSCTRSPSSVKKEAGWDYNDLIRFFGTDAISSRIGRLSLNSIGIKIDEVVLGEDVFEAAQRHAH